MRYWPLKIRQTSWSNHYLPPKSRRRRLKPQPNCSTDPSWALWRHRESSQTTLTNYSKLETPSKDGNTVHGRPTCSMQVRSRIPSRSLTSTQSRWRHSLNWNRSQRLNGSLLETSRARSFLPRCSNGSKRFTGMVHSSWKCNRSETCLTWMKLPCPQWWSRFLRRRMNT